MTRKYFGCVVAAFVFATLVPAATAQTVRQNWSEDGSRFWFRSTDSNGARAFFIVDTAVGSRTPAFDNEKVASALSKVLKENVAAANLPIESIEFTDSIERLLLRSQGKWWRLNVNSYEVAKVERPKAERSANRLFLPAHRSGDGGEATNIFIENRLDRPLEFFWVATDGSERRYGTIKPGETREQHTYVDHVWMLKSDNGESLACFDARVDAHLVIDDDAIRDIRREKHPQMDLTRVGIYGGSAGGQNAMAALLWHNDFYKVAVADCGCHDNRMDKIWWNEQWMGWPVDDSYKENSNMENAHLLKGDLMLQVGELDHNVDPASTTQVVRQLIKHNKDFEFVLVAGAGHGSAETPWASQKRLSFLKQHLNAD